MLKNLEHTGKITTIHLQIELLLTNTFQSWDILRDQ